MKLKLSTKTLSFGRVAALEDEVGSYYFSVPIVGDETPTEAFERHIETQNADIAHRQRLINTLQARLNQATKEES